MGRPQGEINRLVERCDYLILVLWDRWGSHPGGERGATSGSEEEYEVARECLTAPDYPMRDIAVLFKGVNPEKMSDPGDELKKVLAFRRKLEDNQTLLYETFDTPTEYDRIVRRRLASWMR